jgi:hypothetical protein
VVAFFTGAFLALLDFFAELFAGFFLLFCEADFFAAGFFCTTDFFFAVDFLDTGDFLDAGFFDAPFLLFFAVVMVISPPSNYMYLRAQATPLRLKTQRFNATDT